MTGARRQSEDDDAGARRSGLRVGALGFRVYHEGGDGLPPVFPGRDAVADAIDTALQDVADPSDPSYWVIRRLDVQFRTVAALGAAHLAQAFAAQVRARIRRVLAGEIVDGVRRYDSRADWLADCLCALAEGGAAQHWHFGRYRDHAGLPPGDAVRLTVQADVTTAHAALARLAATQRIRPFCDRIGEAACRAVLRLILPAAPRAHSDLVAPLQLLLQDEKCLTPQRRYAPALTAIARLGATQMAAPLPSFAALDQAGRLVVLPTSRAPLAAMRLRSDDASRGQGSPAERMRPAVVQAPGHALGLSSSKPYETAAPAPGFETGFAGVFVLWRSVIELDLLALLPQGAAGGPARLALAATLAGPDRKAAWADPALQWLCNHTPNDGDAFPDAPKELAHRFADHFAAGRRPHPVVPTLTRVGRSHVLQDLITEDWLWVGDKRTAHRRAARIGTPMGLPAAGARDPGVDLHWFGVTHRCDRRPWALLARAAYGDFARRLNGLQGASAAWSWGKLLAGWGLLEQGHPARITLPHVPLDLVLRMGGLDGTVITAPGGAVEIRLPGAM
jgi:hypothetical protein